MPPPDSAPPKPKRKRRWLQFSVRTLLVLMLLASVPLGWVRIELNRIAREDEAVAAILELGGSVSFEGDRSGPPNPAKAKPAWLRRLLGDRYFRRVDYVRFPRGADDEAVAHLGGLRRIRALALRGTRAGGAAFDPIWQHRELTRLDLSSTAIGDEEATHLAGLSQLRVLELANTRVTDRTAEVLLEKLPQLWSLDLRGTHVSMSAAEELKSACGGRSSRFTWSPVFTWSPAPSEARRQIAASLEQSGASVVAEPVEEDSAGRRSVAGIYSVTLSGRWKGGMTGLKQLAQLSPVHSLILMGAPLTDEERAYVAGLRFGRGSSGKP
jgi:hypothetical protein